LKTSHTTCEGSLNIPAVTYDNPSRKLGNLSKTPTL
jgi:hypothetical protein